MDVVTVAMESGKLGLTRRSRRYRRAAGWPQALWPTAGHPSTLNAGAVERCPEGNALREKIDALFAGLSVRFFLAYRRDYDKESKHSSGPCRKIPKLSSIYELYLKQYASYFVGCRWILYGSAREFLDSEKDNIACRIFLPRQQQGSRYQ